MTIYRVKPASRRAGQSRGRVSRKMTEDTILALRWTRKQFRRVGDELGKGPMMKWPRLQPIHQGPDPPTLLAWIDNSGNDIGRHVFQRLQVQN